MQINNQQYFSVVLQKQHEQRRSKAGSQEHFIDGFLFTPSHKAIGGELKATLYRIADAAMKETSSKQPDITEPSNYQNFKIDSMMKPRQRSPERETDMDE